MRYSSALLRAPLSIAGEITTTQQGCKNECHKLALCARGS